MSGAQDDEKATAEFLLELAKHNGVGCVTVGNGHMLAFSKRTLQGLLKQCEASGQDKVIIFVHRPDMKAGS